MTIEIPSGPPGSTPVGSAEAAGEALGAAGKAAETGGATAVGADAIARIAAEVAAGEIGRSQAVERLLAEALGSDIAARAPAAVRAELAEVLEALIETDPHLQSLAAGIGPKTD